MYSVPIRGDWELLYGGEEKWGTHTGHMWSWGHRKLTGLSMTAVPPQQQEVCLLIVVTAVLLYLELLYLS